MTRSFIAVLVAGTIGLGIAPQASADDWRHQDGYHRYHDRHDRHWRDRDRHHQHWRDRDQRDRYYRSQRPSYEPTGACTFQSRRGPVTGYRPAGKDRCCIETSRGPSCQ